jgi:hypothetical protein
MLHNVLPHKVRKNRDEGHGFNCQVPDMVYRMSPDIVYSFGLAVPYRTVTDDGFNPCHTDSGSEGFRQMGKRLLTKGTGSAVP